MAIHRSIKYLVVLLAVLADILEDRHIDALLVARGLQPSENLWDDVVSGLLLGAVIFVVLHYFDRSKEHQRQQLHTIANMNHHVRNALQIIQCRAPATDATAIRDIDEAVNRIDWALREVLPGGIVEETPYSKRWVHRTRVGGGKCPS